MNVFIQKLVSLLTDCAAVTVCENIGLIVFLFNDPLFSTFLYLPLYLSLTKSACSKTVISFKHKTYGVSKK